MVHDAAVCSSGCSSSRTVKYERDDVVIQQAGLLPIDIDLEVGVARVGIDERHAIDTRHGQRQGAIGLGTVEGWVSEQDEKPPHERGVLHGCMELLAGGGWRGDE